MAKRWLSKVTLRRVTLHLDTNQSIEGSIAAESLDGVVLRAAKVLGDDASRDAEMPGEVWVPRERIMFAQDVAA